MSGAAVKRSFVGDFQLALRLATREMRGGLSGFYIFLACIALGTAAIAGVNSVSQSITASIASEGQGILGGDIRFELANRTATDAELSWFNEQGTMAYSSTLRSMARLPDGSDQALVEVKAVDSEYPLYGTFEVVPAMSLADMFAEQSGQRGAVVAQLFLDRLGLAIGDRVLLGNETFEIRAVVGTEPDALSDGFAFAPRMFVSDSGLEASGLIQVGSLVEHNYKIRFAGTPTPNELQTFIQQANERFPDSGWTIRSSANAAPSLSANIVRFSQFLTLVGLTALIVGGVGVANAVRAFLDSKRSVIATFKCLGASGSFVVMVYLLQILMIATVGIAIGLVVGALMPFVASWALADLLPVGEGALYPGALILAALFGFLTSLTFAIIPLGRAHDVPATALFREQGFSGVTWPRLVYSLSAALLVATLAAMAVFTAFDRNIAMIFLGAIAFAFVVLRFVAIAVQALARRAPRVQSTALRFAIGNIHRPGALTPSVVLSLGLGLALLVTLALIDGNLRRELSGNLPERAPNFFFVDIQSHEIEQFSDLVAQNAPEGLLVRVPMLRGRILELNGQNVSEIDIPPGAQWVTRGDRGITYSADLPENSVLEAGEWWAPDYSGEPLVSLAAEEAAELGLVLGDTVTVNVLGRTLTARISNLRRVEWESLSINFVMVFSPNTFAGAPHAWLATLTDATVSPEAEGEILRSVTNTFPTITTVRVKDAIDIVTSLVGQLATAIRAAAAVALVASVLVLSGALAAGNRARVHDSVVLKTLGATRPTLIRAFSYEYLILGLATALFALMAGGVAAWFVVSQIMTLPSQFLPDVAILTVATALIVTVGIGLIGTWRILGHKAAPVLRNL